MTDFAGGELSVARDGALAVITIAREAARNAATLAIWKALPELAAWVEADPSIRAVILRGEGERAFCAGADIAEFPEVFATPESGRAYNDAMRAGQAALAGIARPVIAMIHGGCVGAGVGLALSCDLRFASDKAKFGVPPAKLGAVYPFPDVKRLVDLLGPARAKDMLFSARVLQAEEALSCGLIDRICAPEALEETALAYARELCALAPGSIAASKAMVGAIQAGAAQETPELRALADDAFAGDEFREGYRAFLEKRAPDFS